MKITRIVDFLLDITSAGADRDTNKVMHKPKRTYGTTSFGATDKELAAVPTEFKYYS